MLYEVRKPPEHIKIGKAKAMETMVLATGTRLFKKTKVRYWVERQGALESYFIIYKDRSYLLSQYEFKRRFKVVIRSGELKKESPAATVS